MRDPLRAAVAIDRARRDLSAAADALDCDADLGALLALSSVDLELLEIRNSLRLAQIVAPRDEARDGDHA